MVALGGVGVSYERGTPVTQEYWDAKERYEQILAKIEVETDQVPIKARDTTISDVGFFM